MLDAGERAYAFTKACAILGKSFIGERVSALASLRSLSELDRLLFPDQRHDLPGPELLAELENRIVKRSIENIISVIKSFDKPPAALVYQLRSFEYADIKTCLHYLGEGKKTMPPFYDLGDFGTVQFKLFPDIHAMLEKTEYNFLLAKLPDKFNGSNCDLTVLEAELDFHYYLFLTESMYLLSGDDREIACRILAKEISLRNCMWALRLRTYFKMTGNEAGKHLMDIKMPAPSDDPGQQLHINKTTGNNKNKISLAKDAFVSLDKPLDSRTEWRGWKWEKLLNPKKPNQIWEADPRYFQNAASHYLYRQAYKNFRGVPFSVSAIFCFIKLKQFEEDLLISISEGLSLGMNPGDVFSLLGVTA